MLAGRYAQAEIEWQMFQWHMFVPLRQSVESVRGDERRGNICLEFLSPRVTLLFAQLQTFIFWLGERSIITICFHSSFCILSASSLTHSFSVSRAHTQIRSPPSHSMDQRLVGVLDESYQQFTQFKASFKLLPFQSGTVLITDNSFRSRKEFWRTFVVRWCCHERVLR